MSSEETRRWLCRRGMPSMLCLPALIARLSTDPPASELDQVSKCRIWSGPHKAAASKTGFALCSGRPSRGCREPPVFAFPWWPSIPTDIFETFSESLNGRIGTLPVTASLPIHVLQKEVWNWSGWVGLVPYFQGSFGTPIWGPYGSDK